jgi:hypothetical protein
MTSEKLLVETVVDIGDVIYISSVAAGNLGVNDGDVVKVSVPEEGFEMNLVAQIKDSLIDFVVQIDEKLPKINGFKAMELTVSKAGDDVQPAQETDRGASRSIPFAAYAGSEPFVFVSYAHKDRERVYPIIKHLHEQEINIWYDEGIEAGADWRAQIIKNLRSCAKFIVFLSPYAVTRHDVLNEIAIAEKRFKEENVTMIPVLLDNFVLPDEIEYTFGRIPIINKQILDQDMFLGQLMNALTAKTLSKSDLNDLYLQLVREAQALTAQGRWTEATEKFQHLVSLCQMPGWTEQLSWARTQLENCKKQIMQKGSHRLPPPGIGPPTPATSGGGGLLSDLRRKLVNNPNAPPEMKMAAMSPPPMGPPRSMPSPLGAIGPPGPVQTPSQTLQPTKSSFDFSPEEIYTIISNMEEFLLSRKSVIEPFKFAQQLGFTDPEILYNFIVSLGREDLFRFDGGKIVVNVSMSPLDCEEFLKSFEKYLKTGEI